MNLTSFNKTSEDVSIELNSFANLMIAVTLICLLILLVSYFSKDLVSYKVTLMAGIIFSANLWLDILFSKTKLFQQVFYRTKS
jgi:hypothetical protein